MRVLLISDSGAENITDVLTSAGLHVTDSSSACEEIKRRDYDYIIAPPELVTLRVKGHIQTDEDIKKYHTGRLRELFESRSGEIEESLIAVREEIRASILDAAKAEEAICEVYSAAAERVFTDNEWLELYLSRELYRGAASAYLAERLSALFREYTELFPPVANDKTEEVILYILNNPESDLRQKTIASKMYVNSSYLSTVFAAQTGERFVDYLTSVKLKRAAYLLMNSPLRVSEIAARLDYKDIGYFSRLFKARYSMPPSEYRIPDNYTYEI